MVTPLRRTSLIVYHSLHISRPYDTLCASGCPSGESISSTPVHAGISRELLVFYDNGLLKIVVVSCRINIGNSNFVDRLWK